MAAAVLRRKNVAGKENFIKKICSSFSFQKYVRDRKSTVNIIYLTHIL